MGYVVSRGDGWWMPDWLWERIAPLLPPSPFHPSGVPPPRGWPSRSAMDAILLVLRTETGLKCAQRDRRLFDLSAYRRF